MTERAGIITFEGKSLTLIGNEIKVGIPAPDCELVDKDLNPVKLSSFRKQVVIIATMPSLDTPVCDTEAHRFSDEVSLLYPQVQLLVVSMDLPFAQKRWCGSAGLSQAKNLIRPSGSRVRPGLWYSDQRITSFGPRGFCHRRGWHGAVCATGKRINQ